jgi:hypothetical protein
MIIDGEIFEKAIVDIIALRTEYKATGPFCVFKDRASGNRIGLAPASSHCLRGMVD